MNPHVIKVPDLGEGIVEVELVAWRVQPGDRVSEDQVLVDVMTDKATVEIPAPVAGVVLALGGAAGQFLPVGAELIRIDPGAGADLVAAAAVGAAALLPVEAAPAPRPAASGAPSAPRPPSATSPPSAPSAPASASQPRPIASPAVRARAWEMGLDLNRVPASGAAGRILQADLDACAASGVAGVPPRMPHPAPGVVAGAAPGVATAVATAVAAAAATHAVPLTGLRRRIARQLQLSARSIPHFTYVEEVDVTELEALRAQLNAAWGAVRGHLTLLPFLIRAMVQGVAQFPQVNGRFDDATGVLTRYDAVHAGIATQTEAGLMVPVLRDAQARDLWAVAAEIARLAAAARSGRVVRAELSGSTITLTSLGRLGGIASTPVINHPEVAIVGVNRIVLRPVIRDGIVAARQLMNLSSSFDHRVIDGADAAGFVQCLRRHLEHPATLFIE